MRISVIAMVVVGLVAGVATAQPVPDKPAAQAAFTEGQQRYAAGEYLPAAVKFEAAYAFDSDPVYLFNVAQAYRLGNACSKAVSYYNRFLAAVPNPPNLDKVKQYLEQAEACEKASAPPDPPSLPGGSTDPVVENPPIPERPAPEDPGRTGRWLGIGAIFLGGAALGIGVYYGTVASRLDGERADLQRGCLTVTCEAGYGNALDAQGDRANLREGVALTVGGVAVIGGVVLFLLNRSSEGSSIAIVPTSGGAAAVGAFRF